MSIYDALKKIVDDLEPHADSLTDRGSYVTTGIALEVETREQFDAVLAEFPFLTERPPAQLYANQPYVHLALGNLGGVRLSIVTLLPTVKRVCDFCDDKHDCTHVESL